MSNQLSKIAFVTGASGFTGGYLCRELIRRGYHVRALVRSSTRSEHLRELGVEIIPGDLCEDPFPAYALQGVDSVYHIAAVFRQEAVPDDYFFKVNVGGTQRVMDAALRAGVPKVVHCSTVGVLGNVKNLPGTETSPYNPGDVYQISKVEGEKLALSYFREKGLAGAVIRPGAIYGPGDMRFLKLFYSINRGIFWMIGKGETYNHFVYIEDLIDGIILAGEREEANSEVFILAGQSPIKLKDLVKMIAEVTGSRVPSRHLPLQPVMLAGVVFQKIFRPLGIEPPIYPRRIEFFVNNRAFDISKAKQLLGYQPKVELRDGLARTAEWYKLNNYL